MRLLSFTLAAASCFAAFAVQAQSTTKPGLWEITSKMNSPTNPQLDKQMQEAQKAMASMPPAQRKQMEEMMAKQGMSMNMKGDGSTALKICITPEMAARPPVEQQKDCTYNFSQRGNVHNFSFKCSKPVSDGTGEVVFSGSDAYNGKMRINTTEGGKKETVDMVTSGKFLSANCGAIKPMAVPKG